jgi:hypothetical protein
MRNEFNIIFQKPNEKNQSMLTVNETMLYKDNDYLTNAFLVSIS